MFKNKFSTNYFCVCNQSYSQKRQVRKHVRLCKHAQNPDKKDLLQLAISKCQLYSAKDNQSSSKDRSNVQFKCGCEKRFHSKGGYYRHIKKCNLRPKQLVVTGKTKCNEPGCLLTFKYIRDFRQHLIEKHQIQFDVEDKKFDKYSDFLHWKVNYESETCSCFYHRKTLKRTGCRVEYWYCNRSGIYQSTLQSRQRKLKSQGILKINNNCTSSIRLTINEIDGTVQAIIYHTHYGHDAELLHLRIPKSDKQEIASKLLQGVQIEDILLSYKEDGLSKQIERKHLIKRRDILNISKMYNVNIMVPKVPESKRKKHYEFIQETIEPTLIDSSPNMIEINRRHFIASQFSLSCVSPTYENVWRISVQNTLSLSNYNWEIYDVTKNNVKCFSDDCKSYCNCCNICYHSYSCTCIDFISKKIICEHVHLIVLFQTNPQTYQYDNHIERPHGNQDQITYTKNCTESSTLQQSVENVHLGDNPSENYVHKQNTKAEDLKIVKIRLEKLIMNTLQKIGECNNSDLLENLEKQITNITRNLGTDLLQNTKSSNEIQTIISPKKNVEVYYLC